MDESKKIKLLMFQTETNEMDRVKQRNLALFSFPYQNVLVIAYLTTSRSNENKCETSLHKNSLDKHDLFLTLF